MKGDGGALNVNEAVFCMGLYKICSCRVHRINVFWAAGPRDAFVETYANANHPTFMKGNMN
jgi:hypothetical protein